MDVDMRFVYQLWWLLRQRQPMILEMLVALCLAFLIWLYAHSRAQDTIDNVLIPVSLQLSAAQQSEYELDIRGPRQVTVSFAGPSSRIRELRYTLQRGLLKAVIPCSVPEERLKDSRFSEKIALEPGHVAVPPGVRLVLTEEGNMLQVTFYRLVERELPVHLEHSPDVRVRPVQLDPPTVMVRGPQEILDRARFIPTQLYTFTQGPEGTVEESVVQGQVELVTEMGGRPVQTRPEQVNFTCRVHPKQKNYELADVPVLFLCPPGFRWTPSFGADQLGKVTLRIIGPPGDESPLVYAYVDLTKGNFHEGRNLEPIRVQLPRDYQLAPQNPQMVSFYLDEK
jgi:hypothetical protein